MQCLVDVLRGIAENVAYEPAEWVAAVDVAAEQNVSPMFAAQVLRFTGNVPEDIREALTAVQRDAAVQAFWFSSELRGLLLAFAEARIKVIPLKGPFLAERIYGSADKRICRDLDLLVRRHDVKRSEQLLLSQGFVTVGHSDDYHRPWARGATGVELHFDVVNPMAFNFDTDEAWRRATLSSFRGAPAWQFDVTDELIYLCLHGARHRFNKLSLVLDLKLMIARYSEDLTRPLRLRSGQSSLSNIAVLGCAMACYVSGDSAQGLSFPVQERVERAMEALSVRLWSELMDGPSTTLDWSSLHRFFLETEVTAWARARRQLRHARILMKRLIEDDFDFAEKFGLRKRWQVRLLRPLRLLLRS